MRYMYINLFKYQKPTCTGSKLLFGPATLGKLVRVLNYRYESFVISTASLVFLGSSFGRYYIADNFGKHIWQNDSPLVLVKFKLILVI